MTDAKKIKPLRTEYATNGFRYRLLDRSDKIALYEVLASRSEKRYGYEVQVIRTIKIPDRWRHGGIRYQGYDYLESNPGNEDFGRYGWTFQSENEARRCFNETVTRRVSSDICMPPRSIP